MLPPEVAVVEVGLLKRPPGAGFVVPLLRPENKLGFG